MGLYGISTWWLIAQRPQCVVRLILGASRAAIARLVFRRIAFGVGVGCVSGGVVTWIVIGLADARDIANPVDTLNAIGLGILVVGTVAVVAVAAAVSHTLRTSELRIS
jgi:hypothetical protein